ncbi:hypothetical protein T10_5998 [Trichinella papuae]|uniref:Uncharacterized protein n=1 Tax=Trichinella papuae TaxID=268474 RepID=A0A0V1N6P0_9BILA|nr:hypothetical protein T10_5998 [Trichinella papuae]
MSRFYQPWQREDDESLAGDRRSGPRHGKRDSMQPVENQEDPETGEDLGMDGVHRGGGGSDCYQFCVAASPWNVKRMGVPSLSHLFD